MPARHRCSRARASTCRRRRPARDSDRHQRPGRATADPRHLRRPVQPPPRSGQPMARRRPRGLGRTQPPRESHLLGRLIPTRVTRRWHDAEPLEHLLVPVHGSRTASAEEAGQDDQTPSYSTTGFRLLVELTLAHRRDHDSGIGGSVQAPISRPRFRCSGGSAARSAHARPCACAERSDRDDAEEVASGADEVGSGGPDGPVRTGRSSGDIRSSPSEDPRPRRAWPASYRIVPAANRGRARPGETAVRPAEMRNPDHP